VLKVETTRKIGQLTFTLDRFEPEAERASHWMHQALINTKVILKWGQRPLLYIKVKTAIND
jgi:hypothetical protein